MQKRQPGFQWTKPSVANEVPPPATPTVTDIVPDQADASQFEDALEPNPAEQQRKLLPSQMYAMPPPQPVQMPIQLSLQLPRREVIEDLSVVHVNRRPIVPNGVPFQRYTNLPLGVATNDTPATAPRQCQCPECR